MEGFGSRAPPRFMLPIVDRLALLFVWLAPGSYSAALKADSEKALGEGMYSPRSFRLRQRRPLDTADFRHRTDTLSTGFTPVWWLMAGSSRLRRLLTEALPSMLGAVVVAVASGVRPKSQALPRLTAEEEARCTL